MAEVILTRFSAVNTRKLPTYPVFSTRVTSSPRWSPPHQVVLCTDLKRRKRVINLQVGLDTVKGIKQQGINTDNLAYNSRVQAGSNIRTQTLNPADPLESIPHLE